jgi:hypothetical protein
MGFHVAIITAGADTITVTVVVTCCSSLKEAENAHS